MPEETTVTPKEWYQSKTLWVNISAVFASVGVWAQSGFDFAMMWPTMGAGLLAVVNMVLRIVTKRPIEG